MLVSPLYITVCVFLCVVAVDNLLLQKNNQGRVQVSSRQVSRAFWVSVCFSVWVQEDNQGRFHVSSECLCSSVWSRSTPSSGKRTTKPGFSAAARKDTPLRLSDTDQS